MQYYGQKSAQQISDLKQIASIIAEKAVKKIELQRQVKSKKNQ